MNSSDTVSNFPRLTCTNYTQTSWFYTFWLPSHVTLSFLSHFVTHGVSIKKYPCPSQHDSPTLPNYLSKHVTNKLTHSGSKISHHLSSVLWKLSEFEGIFLHWHRTLPKIHKLIHFDFLHLSRKELIKKSRLKHTTSIKHAFSPLTYFYYFKQSWNILQLIWYYYAQAHTKVYTVS